MAKKTYHGSCHCKSLAFEADIDLDQGTGKCNCTYCWKVRNWSAGITPADFRITSGTDTVGEYGFRENSMNKHLFCTRCGVRVGTRGSLPGRGPYVSVAVATLDDLPVEDLIAAPVRYMNGRDEDWFHEPAEKRQL